ncbi:MAG: DegT/DnrJ/EryC1/StrS family aminotransferase [Dehalococcoidia bacterium]|nr:DegT/DnrJ/EryC1/StrS family aminotransferase [Dehalococcoidia bacterium]
MERIPVAGPWVTDREIAYVTDAARNGWYGNWNEYIDRFERAFAAAIDVPYAISLPSGTAGIHLAMAALGIGPGDEVIVPEATWIASASPAVHLGATPIFADIDPATWCIDAASFAANITGRTKAVVVVDLYGSMPDMDAIEIIAARHGIAVIEDAAEALGSTYAGRQAGSFGHVGVFSFHGTKTMTTGEGGMLVTANQDLYQRALVLRDQGRDPNERQRLWNNELGYKFKMSGLQAAFGLGQVERIDELVAKKRQIFGWYADRLSASPGITLNAEPAGVWNSYWMTTAIFDRSTGITKERAMDFLDRQAIDSRPFFYPLSSLPPLAGYGPGREANPIAYDISARGINLPSALSLSEDDVDRVCTALNRLLAAVPRAMTTSS